MLKGLFTEENIFIKLILTASVAIVGLLFCSIMAYIVSFLFFGVQNLNELSLLLQNNTSVLEIFQFFQSIGLFVIPAFLMAYILSNNVRSFLFFKKPSAEISIIGILTIITAVPFINWLSAQNAAIQFPAFLEGIEQWMKNSEEAATLVTEKFLQANSFSGLLMNIFLMAIVPAISEELFFRGLLQNYFYKSSKNIHLAIWIGAFVFSAFHLQFYGFMPRLLMGAFLGYLLVWSGSIWVPIMAHFINNALAVVFYYLHSNGYTDVNIDTIGIKETLYLSVLSFILTFALVVVLKRRSTVNY